VQVRKPLQFARRQEAAPVEKSRLIGWFVTYADEDEGRSHEIRSGRVLIGSDDSSRNALRIRGAQIDTPHAALEAAPDRITLLDIFSSGGTFLRRSGETAETKVEQPIDLQHGDWIRFGEKTWFQVCLIQNAH
jgi:pSer/pThr/pTyr-binding forkhead associated (FHA) protein